MVEEAKKKNDKWMLVLLVLMFGLPVAASWYLVFHTDYAREGAGAEHGQLIQPPRQLPEIDLYRAGEKVIDQTALHGKWSMLFFIDGSCDKQCEDNLYRVRQIRLATGKRMLNLQRVAVVQNGDDNFDQFLQKEYPGQRYIDANDLAGGFLGQFADIKEENDAAIYLIDPRGFLMMRYPADTDPSGIIRDVSRMLKISG